MYEFFEVFGSQNEAKELQKLVLLACLELRFKVLN